MMGDGPLAPPPPPHSHYPMHEINRSGKRQRNAVEKSEGKLPLGAIRVSALCVSPFTRRQWLAGLRMD